MAAGAEAPAVGTTAAGGVFWRWTRFKPHYAAWWPGVGLAAVGLGALVAAAGGPFHAWPMAFVFFVLGILPVVAIRAADAFDDLAASLAGVAADPAGFREDLAGVVAMFFSARSRLVWAGGLGNGMVTALAAAHLGLPFGAPLPDAAALAVIALVGVFCGFAAVQALGLFALGWRLPRLAVRVSLGDRCDRVVAELRRRASQLSLAVLTGYLVFYLAIRTGPFPLGPATPWLLLWGLLPLGCVVWGAVQIQGFQRAVKFANLDLVDAMLRSAHARSSADPSPENLERQRMLLEQRAILRAEPYGFSVAGASAFVASALAAATQVALQLGELRAALAALMP